MTLIMDSTKYKLQGQVSIAEHLAFEGQLNLEAESYSEQQRDVSKSRSAVGFVRWSHA